jgi:serine/threonine protein kinase
MRLPPGTVLGPYVIGRPLGVGGMGEVYRAQDPRLGRDVAVKALAAGRAPDAEQLRRFEREARATTALAHPNILTIFDVGAHEGLPFLVCELLEGQTLRDLLAPGALPPARAVELGLQLAREVAAAHALRIVHRDLKPENLFLTRDGTLKILDFGLAKLRPEVVAGPETATLEASMSGGLVGTPAYMAPEQLRGEPVDHRADLFAIGAILYEMVTGGSPFRRPSGAETLAAILREAPAALETGPELPPGLERLILHCLEKDPGDRFQAAADGGPPAARREARARIPAPRLLDRGPPLHRHEPHAGPGLSVRGKNKSQGRPARRLPCSGGRQFVQRCDDGLARSDQFGKKSLVYLEVAFVLSAIPDVMTPGEHAPYSGAETESVGKNLEDDISIDGAVSVPP